MFLLLLLPVSNHEKQEWAALFKKKVLFEICIKAFSRT